MKLFRCRFRDAYLGTVIVLAEHETHARQIAEHEALRHRVYSKVTEVALLADTNASEFRDKLLTPRAILDFSTE